MKLILQIHTLMRCLIVFLLTPIQWVVKKFVHLRLRPARSVLLDEHGAGRLTSNQLHRLDASFLRRAGLACAVAMVTLLFLCGINQARADFVSFNTTNFLAGNNTITSYPTNSVLTATNQNGSGTNLVSIGQLTGSRVSVANYERATFVFKGIVTTSNACNLAVNVLRGTVDTPLTLMTTNTGAITNTDWETTSQLPLLIPLPAGTNVFVCWQTNLDQTYLAGDGAVGIYSIANTNQFCNVTNTVFGLARKIIPRAIAGGNF